MARRGRKLRPAGDAEQIGIRFCPIQPDAGNSQPHFVYDKDNILRYVDTLKKLCLAPSDMGSNYHLNQEEMRQLLRDTLRVERGSILEPIRAIEVRPFFGNGSKVSSAS